MLGDPDSSQQAVAAGSRAGTLHSLHRSWLTHYPADLPACVPCPSGQLSSCCRQLPGVWLPAPACHCHSRRQAPGGEPVLSNKLPASKAKEEEEGGGEGEDGSGRACVH